MKPFSTYQHIEGEPMTDRDKREVGSKFWNEGKWDNFVNPFLPDNCNDMTLIDMGCNAGLFLRLAEDKGFKNVIGVESNKEAVERAIRYRDRNGGKYDIQRRRMEKSVDKLPVADYVILANIHYYLDVSDWLDYVDRLQSKTRFCIVVTDEDRRNPLHKTSASVKALTNYFKTWMDSFVCDGIEAIKDPHPRKLKTIIFKSRIVRRMYIGSLDNGNHQQDDFYQQLDDGIEVLKTNYWRRMKSYRMKEHGWPKDRVVEFMLNKAKLYDDIKKRGLMSPIVVNTDMRIVDGNHRCAMLKHLGYKSILVRRVI